MKAGVPLPSSPERQVRRDELTGMTDPGASPPIAKDSDSGLRATALQYADHDALEPE